MQELRLRLDNVWPWRTHFVFVLTCGSKLSLNLYQGSFRNVHYSFLSAFSQDVTFKLVVKKT